MFASWAPSTASCWSPTPRWRSTNTATLWWTSFRLRPTAASWCWHQVRCVLRPGRTAEPLWWSCTLSNNLSVFSDQKPDVMYADIGGMDIQKQEVREAVELPLTHFELYKQVGSSSLFPNYSKTSTETQRVAATGLDRLTSHLVWLSNTLYIFEMILRLAESRLCELFMSLSSVLQPLMPLAFRQLMRTAEHEQVLQLNIFVVCRTLRSCPDL